MRRIRGPVSPLWLKYDPLGKGMGERLDGLFASAPSGLIFFRADDVGAPSPSFSRLVELFAGHAVPLCLAVVPSWLSEPRWKALLRTAGDTGLWAWHQHGYCHRNREPDGKKCEFGPGRTLEQKTADIENGRRRLETIMGKAFLPVFTPPWNRLDAETALALPGLGFRAVSAHRGTNLPQGAPQSFPVYVDLHTRRESDPRESLDNLFGELGSGLQGGAAGIMLHHQLMNDPAFAFLDLFLSRLKAHENLRPCHFGRLLEQQGSA